jgi:hypothetical protein
MQRNWISRMAKSLENWIDNVAGLPSAVASIECRAVTRTPGLRVTQVKLSLR